MTKFASLFKRRQKQESTVTAHLGFWHRFWADTLKPILTAVLAALLIRQFLIQAFHIPTGSMKETLLIGDFLFVNKFLYGAKSPERLRVPLVNWTLVDGLPTFELPGFRDPVQGDIIVFEYPLDRDQDYIKRCVGVAGDRIVIREGVLYVNDEVYEDVLNHPELDNSEGEVDRREPPHSRHDPTARRRGPNWSFDLATALEPPFRLGDRSRSPYPVYVPLPASLRLIETALAGDFGLDPAQVMPHLEALRNHVAGTRPLNDRTVRQHLDRIAMEAKRMDVPYVIPDDHIFMMGDNRDNSQDSRFWGPLDVEKIKGKALFIYWSWDKEKKRPRLSKIGDLIH